MLTTQSTGGGGAPGIGAFLAEFELPTVDYGDTYGPYLTDLLQGAAVLRGSVEHLEFLVGCLQAEGFNASIADDGGIAASPGVDQGANYVTSLEACRNAASSIGLVPPEGPTPQILELQYVGFTTITNPCLVENGFATSEPPSLETYLESDGALWYPGIDLGPEFDEAERVCPFDVLELAELLGSGG